MEINLPEETNWLEWIHLSLMGLTQEMKVLSKHRSTQNKEILMKMIFLVIWTVMH